MNFDEIAKIIVEGHVVGLVTWENMVKTIETALRTAYVEGLERAYELAECVDYGCQVRGIIQSEINKIKKDSE